MRCRGRQQGADAGAAPEIEPFQARRPSQALSHCGRAALPQLRLAARPPAVTLPTPLKKPAGQQERGHWMEEMEQDKGSVEVLG